MLSLLLNRLDLNSRLSTAKGQEEYIILIFPIQKLKLRILARTGLQRYI